VLCLTIIVVAAHERILEQPTYWMELIDKNILSNIKENDYQFFTFRSSRGGFYFFVGKKVNKKPCPLRLFR
jgi:hypothetical protein